MASLAAFRPATSSSRTFSTSCLNLSTLPVFIFYSMAQASEPETRPVEEEVVTGSVRQQLEQAGTLLNTIRKTKVIGLAVIVTQHAANLSQAIAGSPGKRVSTECTICGAKRIMLNGFKSGASLSSFKPWWHSKSDHMENGGCSIYH